MNADMLNRGTEDRPPPLSLSLLVGGGGGERPLRPPLDPPLLSPSTCGNYIFLDIQCYAL